LDFSEQRLGARQSDSRKEEELIAHCRTGAPMLRSIDREDNDALGA
jgi:hypothetical protein